MSAWQPVLAPKWTIVGLPVLGIISIVLGVCVLLTSQSITECKKKYSDPASVDNPVKIRLQITSEDCSTKSAASIEGPVYLYYRLTDFYQNHRLYLMSRSTKQLAGEIIVDPAEYKNCNPAVSTADGNHILTPCGLAARSVFNDTIRPIRYDGSPIPMKESAEDIVWPQSIISKYKNPQSKNPEDLNRLNQWLDKSIFPKQIEDPHFIVWMRDAALPDFKKLYGILESVTLPFTVEIDNRYPVSAMGGEKYIVITNTKWIGGKNDFLAIVLLVLGVILFLIGLFMTVKNKRDPRILGDVRFLRWNKHWKKQ